VIASGRANISDNNKRGQPTIKEIANLKGLQEQKWRNLYEEKGELEQQKQSVENAVRRAKIRKLTENDITPEKEKEKERKARTLL